MSAPDSLSPVSQAEWATLWQKLYQRSVDFNVFFGCVSRKIIYSADKQRFTSTLPGNAKGTRYLDYNPIAGSCEIRNEAGEVQTVTYGNLQQEAEAGWPHLLAYLHGSESFDQIKEALTSAFGAK